MSLLIRNANIATMDSEQPRAQAAVVTGKYFAYVGTEEGAKEYIAAHNDGVCEEVDCGGQLLPAAQPAGSAAPVAWPIAKQEHSTRSAEWASVSAERMRPAASRRRDPFGTRAESGMVGTFPGGRNSWRVPFLSWTSMK